MLSRSTLLAAFTLMLSSAAMMAHEIGTTRVSVNFDDGRDYNVELVTDAASLVEKLAASAGSPMEPETRPQRLQDLLTRYDPMFRRRVKLAFDGMEVRPDISYSVQLGNGAAAAPIATIRLRGTAPSSAAHFTWTYGWTFASYALMVRTQGSANPATEWLEGSQTSQPVALNLTVPLADRTRTAWRYLTLGFTHILPNGFDHVLFVLGIFLLSGRAKTVLLQVSAFTVAHSITLGLSMYGLLSAPSRVVEPLIALSIAYVAIENIFLSELKSWRIGLVFAFGLLHGLGFAGALKELGLPRSEFLTALLTFNVGVEAGQLAVIGIAFLLVGWHFSSRVWYRDRIVVPVSALIACTGIYWIIERLSI